MADNSSQPASCDGDSETEMLITDEDNSGPCPIARRTRSRTSAASLPKTLLGGEEKEECLDQSDDGDCKVDAKVKPPEIQNSDLKWEGFDDDEEDCEIINEAKEKSGKNKEPDAQVEGSEPDEEEASPTEIWPVKAILDCRKAKDGTFEYLLEWENSWQPEENLDGCQKLLNEFKEQRKRQSAESQEFPDLDPSTVKPPQKKKQKKRK